MVALIGLIHLFFFTLITLLQPRSMTTVFSSTSADYITSRSNTDPGTGMVGWGSSLVETRKNQEDESRKSWSPEKEKEEEGQTEKQHERVRNEPYKEGRFPITLR